jgi:hypothetical protein
MTADLVIRGEEAFAAFGSGDGFGSVGYGYD